jgi:hypothetical protein
MRLPNAGMIAAFLIVGAATTQTQAATLRPHSKFIRVETPTNNPQLLEDNPEAIYLRRTGDGRTLLYVEKHDGQGLAVLDVTDPAKIRRIADSELAVNSAFDIVQDVDDNAALIRFRDGSGTALLSFKHKRSPVVVSAPELAAAGSVETLGATGHLVADTGGAPRVPTDPTYEVMDTAVNTAPVLLGTIPNVTQWVTNEETGTLFLLNRHGVTVVRRLRVEQEHEVELMSEQHN